MRHRRFPNTAYRRQLAALERQLRAWAELYWSAAQEPQPAWLQVRNLERYEQLLDVAHTVERARHDLEVIPRLL